MPSPFMIAVSGGSGAGKTTFVNKLWQELERQEPLVLRLDDYYRDLSHLSQAERADCNFDDPAAIESELLYRQVALLRQGQAIERPNYDFRTHTRSSVTARVEPRPIIIVDGIFSLCFPELNELFDLKLFLDVDDDIRVVRRIGRDMLERGRSFASCSEQYQVSVKTMYEKFVAPTKRIADFIIPWQSYNERALSFTAGMILTEIEEKSALNVKSFLKETDFSRSF